MTLEQLRVFAKVIESGSFTEAAELLGTPRSHVSRVIAQLEAELGVVLLERTTRAKSITEAGREVYQRALAILDAVDDTVQVTRRVHDQPSGQLRLTCGVEFGMVAVGAWVEAYLKRHPQVSVEAEYTSRELDLVHEGFDLAIRPGPLAESRLVARRLGRLDYGLFASPGYLAERGTPATPDELADHRLVVFTGTVSRPGWTLHHPAQREPHRLATHARLRVNAGTGVRDALLGDLGIGQLPLVMAEQMVATGQLVRVLDPWHPASVEVHAVYPSSRYLTPKVRAFIEIALAGFPGPSA